MAKNAKFGEAETQAFGIIWEDDLFAPADEDGRSTTQVDAFLAAQTAWLEANLAESDCITQMDEYHRPQLPKGAQQHYGRHGEGVFTAFTIDPRSGLVRETYFTMPQRLSGATAGDADVKPVRAPRPDLTAEEGAYDFLPCSSRAGGCGTLPAALAATTSCGSVRWATPRPTYAAAMA